MFEAGIWKKHNGSYNYFVAYGLSGTETIIADQLLSSKCSVAIGNFYTFRVKWTANIRKWEAHVKCPDGTWKFLKDWVGPPSGDPDGKPMVEVGRDGAGTGLSNHHHNLNFRDANNTWAPWANMGCHLDNNDGWNGVEVAGNHFETVQSGTQSCPAD